MKKSHRAKSTVAEVQGGGTSKMCRTASRKGGTREPYATNIRWAAKVSSKRRENHRFSRALYRSVLAVQRGRHPCQHVIAPDEMMVERGADVQHDQRQHQPAEHAVRAMTRVGSAGRQRQQRHVE